MELESYCVCYHYQKRAVFYYSRSYYGTNWVLFLLSQGSSYRFAGSEKGAYRRVPYICRDSWSVSCSPVAIGFNDKTCLQRPSDLAQRRTRHIQTKTQLHRGFIQQNLRYVWPLLKSNSYWYAAFSSGHHYLSTCANSHPSK